MARDGKKVVFTNGCFDILHAGHVLLLDKARSLGDVLVVGLNSDASVRRLKGPSRPVNCQKDRALVLSGLASVDRVVVFGEPTPAELLAELRPDVLVKGADYRPEQVAGREYAGRVALLKLLKGRSTTGIIKRASTAAR
ncbi:MAG: D-glycero-beta-D-manno-heptose 1-phosphate adenylyltransferase [Elusimicrobia bacterium]|nr:D-glycero-beta-D-manno-heptose 1-phosphate adenylyltransferase [Elusimicrobiota bacterium]